MSRRWIPLALITVLATACSTWSMAGQGASRRGWSRDDTAVTPANVATLTGSWGASAAGTAEPLGSSDAILTTGPQVRGLDPATGATKWSRPRARQRSATPGSSSRRTAPRARSDASRWRRGSPTRPRRSVVRRSSRRRARRARDHRTLVDSDSVVVVPWYYSSISATPSCASAWSVSSGSPRSTARSHRSGTARSPARAVAPCRRICSPDRSSGASRAPPDTSSRPTPTASSHCRSRVPVRASRRGPRR